MGVEIRCPRIPPGPAPHTGSRCAATLVPTFPAFSGGAEPSTNPTPRRPPRRRGVGGVALNLVGGAPGRPPRRGSGGARPARRPPPRETGPVPGRAPPRDIRWSCGSETGHPPADLFVLCHVGVTRSPSWVTLPSRISRRGTRRSMIASAGCPARGRGRRWAALSRTRTGRPRPARGWGRRVFRTTRATLTSPPFAKDTNT
jgi:hypothetical protein